jgi:LAS superfamily LD-carboxypeptidase LdcB
MPLDAKILTGRSEGHLVPFADPGIRVHREAHAALVALAEGGRRAGFELRVRSSFHGFAAQARIWNDKALGRRTICDDAGVQLDTSGFAAPALLHAILRWSALPGASRHHWGTDVDVYDGRAEDGGARIELLPQEAYEGGTCADFEAWLGASCSQLGFFRPYARDLGGVAPEWWHISYAPVSTHWLDALSVGMLREAIEAEAETTPLALTPTVMERLDEIHARYVLNVGV